MLTHPLLTPVCDWSRRAPLHVASRLDILKVNGYEADGLDGLARLKPHFETVKKQPPAVLLPACH